MPVIIIVHNKFLSLLRENIIRKSSTDYTTYNIGHQQLQLLYHMAVITPKDQCPKSAMLILKR